GTAAADKGHLARVYLAASFCVLMPRLPPCATLFPYTTLFRSIQGSLDRLGFGSRAEHFASRVQLRLVQAIVLPLRRLVARATRRDRKSTRLNSSHVSISYAVFCLKKKMIWLTTSLRIKKSLLK